MTLARYLHESFVYDFDAALDLEAESWKRAFEHLRSYGGERPFKSWLLAITRNVLRVDEPHLQEEDPEQRAVSREVLFHADGLDLTVQVVAGLNADWAKAWRCETCKRKVADEKCPDCGAKRP